MDSEYLKRLKKTFGSILKSQRKKRGWSRERAQDYLGVSKSQIQKYEEGVDFPKASNLIHIADVFELSLDGLIGRKSPGKPFTELLEVVSWYEREKGRAEKPRRRRAS